MYYQKGDIFDKTNIVFKETERSDISLHGHPMLIPLDIDFNDNYYYFFTISSQLHYYISDPDRYYRIKKGNGTGLTKSSLVDLKHVYKYRKQSHNVRGSIGESETGKLLAKFNKYINKNADNDCLELMDSLAASAL